MKHMFLIIVDAQSKWIETFLVPSTSTEATIEVLRTVFATHGVPEHLVSDNGSGFTSQLFTEYLTSYGIKHSRTSPYHPSSNGLAERAVQTVKQGLAKGEGTIQERLNHVFFFHTGSLLKLARDLHPLNYLWDGDSVHGWTSYTQIIQPLLHNEKGKTQITEFDSLLWERKRLLEYILDTEQWIPVTVTKVTGPVSYVLRG